jgi:methionyl aminopeptidase
VRALVTSAHRRLIVLILFIERSTSFSCQFKRVFGFIFGFVWPEPLGVWAAIMRLNLLVFEAVVPTHRLSLSLRRCDHLRMWAPIYCARTLQGVSTTIRQPLTPGRISPRRPVPQSIQRPEYVDRPTPAPFTGSDIQTPETIEAMRVAGRIAANALQEVGRNVRPGISTDELDRIGHEYLCDHGAYPSTLGYRGFPKSLCSSLNEVICHGIPDSTELVDGDICNIDITAFIGGVHGDTNATFLVGDVRQEVRLLVERTHEATTRAINAVQPGRPLSVVGRVIESYAKRFNYGVVRDFTGHGISTSFHSGLVVPHYDDPRMSVELQEGMTFTIEPMLTLGTYDYDIWDDGWTVVTKDRRWTAQFEHTIVVTSTGSQILTLPSSPH